MNRLLLTSALAFLAIPAFGQQFEVTPPGANVPSFMGNLPDKPQPVQYRILVGATGGGLFDNAFLGVVAQATILIGRRYEFDLSDEFHPLESNPNIGRGFANSIFAEGVTWLPNGNGISGGIGYSNYRFAPISNGGEYIYVGPIKRFLVARTPVRLGIGYLREIRNGITNGYETSHLQGVNFGTGIRVGCSGYVCYEVAYDSSLARILKPGNPQCDGSGPQNPGLTPCPRFLSTTGGINMSFTLQWPVRQGRENR